MGFVLMEHTCTDFKAKLNDNGFKIYAIFFGHGSMTLYDSQVYVFFSSLFYVWSAIFLFDRTTSAKLLYNRPTYGLHLNT